MNEIKNEFKEKLNELFSTAWKSGDLEGVKSLLSTPYLKDQINIKKDQGSTLSFVCWHGHLDMVKYFLTSPDIKEKSDILADGDNALSFACTQNHKDVVEYLLTSPELTQHAENANFGLKCAISYDGRETMEYLIHDYKLDLTPELKKILKHDNGKDAISYKEVEQIFNARDNLKSILKMI